MFCSWDTRQKAPTSSIQAHDQEILAVAFNPGVESLLITGSADKVRSLPNTAVSQGLLTGGSDNLDARHQKVGETIAHV
jgi:WD40 repeat protein